MLQADITLSYRAGPGGAPAIRLSVRPFRSLRRLAAGGYCSVVSLGRAEIGQKIELFFAQSGFGHHVVSKFEVILVALCEDRPRGQARAVRVTRFCKTNPSWTHRLRKPRVHIVVSVGIHGKIAHEARGGSVNGIGKRTENVGYFGCVEAARSEERRV